MRCGFLFLSVLTACVLPQAHAAVGVGPHFPDGECPQKVIGLRGTLRVDALKPGNTGLIVFGHMRFCGPGQYKTHFIEVNMGNGWVEHEDTGSVPWPPSRNGIEHPNEGGFSIALSDYSREGFVGARPKDLATYLQFPRMNSGIDGIPGLTKIEMGSQENMVGTDVYLEVTRGQTVHFDSAQEHWGSRYRWHDNRQISLDALPPGTYRTWNVKVSFGGRVYCQVMLLPADQAQYFHPEQLIAFVTEFFELQKSRIRIYLWNFQFLQENRKTWEQVRKWKRGYQAGVDPYGPRVTEWDGRHVLEISNDRTPTGYMKRDEITELKANPVVQWKSAESWPGRHELKVRVGIVMDRASALPVTVKVRASGPMVGSGDTGSGRQFDLVVPAGKTEATLDHALDVRLAGQSGDSVCLTLVSATPAAIAGRITHAIRFRRSVVPTEWTPPRVEPLDLEAGLALIEKLGGKTAGVSPLTHLPREINLGYRSVTDRALLRLRHVLEGAEVLNISGCRKITDAGLVHLQKCSRLQRLQLADLSINGDGLKWLAKMAALEHLNLALCNGLKDEGLKHVGQLRRLRSLDLASTGVTPAGLTFLKPLTDLESLVLVNIPVTDADIRGIRTRCPGIQIRR